MLLVEIPEVCLVVLVGATSSGKSRFARKHFGPTEIVSSDHCRAMLADDENDQSVTKEAFELLHSIVAKRLKLGRLTVVDATNVEVDARRSLIAFAKQYHILAVALVFDLPETTLLERHLARTDRKFRVDIIRKHLQHLSGSIRELDQEGFHLVRTFTLPEEVDAVELRRVRLRTDRRDEKGPFDIVGDVHGCYDELVELLGRLGYVVGDDGTALSHPQGRKAVFVGDLVDRGPKTPDVIRLVRSAAVAGTALCVSGNHDVKLARALNGRDVRISFGLEQSLEQMRAETEDFRRQAAEFLNGLVSHYVFDSGRLVVAHAGLSEELQGRSSGKVRSFAMYGETTGETDEFGLPIRYNWAADYRGKAMVVYGHTPVREAEWLNNTICVDTGCVYGGKLTALRYPERELVSVTAQRQYYAPIRPLAASGADRAVRPPPSDFLPEGSDNP